MHLAKTLTRLVYNSALKLCVPTLEISWKKHLQNTLLVVYRSRGVHRLGPETGVSKPMVPNYRRCTAVRCNSIANLVKSPVSALRTQWRFFCIFTPQFGKLSRGLLPYRFVSLFSLPIVLLVIIYNMVSTLKSDKNNSKTNSIGIVKHVPEGLVDWQCVIN